MKQTQKDKLRKKILVWENSFEMYAARDSYAAIESFIEQEVERKWID